MKTTSHHADEDLLPLIKDITDKRPTYGYPRVTAILNRNRREAGRSYRTTHDGQVITMKSDLRWCSDICGIRRLNGLLCEKGPFFIGSRRQEPDPSLNSRQSTR